MTPRRLVSVLLDAVDDVNPRQYLSDVPARLLLEVRTEFEKLGWQFIEMTRSTEAHFSKISRYRTEKYLVWVYVWEAKLYAYGRIKFLDWGENEIEDMEQEEDQTPERFAQWIDTVYMTLGAATPRD